MKSLIIAEKEDAVVVTYMDSFQRLIECKPYSCSGKGQVGSIFLGIVRKKLKGIGAYFIDFGQEKDGYLPFQKTTKPLSPGETVMVQITKDPYSTKGAKLTSQISLSGEYIVLVTDSRKIHFSSKLPEDTWTEETKRALNQLKHSYQMHSIGFIVRTNAYGCHEEDLLNEGNKLVQAYENLLQIQSFRPLKTCIYQPEASWFSYVQNMNKNELDTIYVESKEKYDQLERYLNSFDLQNQITLTFSSDSLFNQYDLKKKIHNALRRKVWLSSGASIIIDRTEAMYVIDVNSDKNISKIKTARNITKINIEAAKEICRQIRLRNLSGIIIIDFIDMLDYKDKKHLLACLEEELGRDRIRSYIHGITKLGLVELTRKRIEPALEDLIKETMIEI